MARDAPEFFSFQERSNQNIVQLDLQTQVKETM